jgi:hypothetical protein
VYETCVIATLLVAAPASLLYAFFYAYRPWFHTAPGRALAIKSWGTALLLNMALLATIWPDYPGRDIVRLVAFVLWAIGIVYLLITLLFSAGARAYPPWNWRKSRREALKADGDS